MTRINVVPVEELCDQHLLAEYRELPRVFRLAHPCPDAPKEYTLGKGHVKFFYDKLGWLLWRSRLLAEECTKRGINVRYPYGFEVTQSTIFSWMLDGLLGSYRPTPEALALNRARIADRLSTMKGVRHASRPFAA